MNDKDLVLKYWNSWQAQPDWQAFRSCPADHCQVNMGVFKTSNAEECMAISQQGNPWKGVKLLELLCNGNQAAILYEGTDIVTGAKIRASEFLTIKDSLMVKSLGNITVLSK